MKALKNLNRGEELLPLPPSSKFRFLNRIPSSGFWGKKREILRPCLCNGLKFDYTSDVSPKWIRQGFSCVWLKPKRNYERVFTNLTSLQEARLKRLRHRMNIEFDPKLNDHQEALRSLWNASYPNEELHGLISEQWKQMGWQGKDPSTDFRGAGFISLENLLFFAKTFSASFQSLLNKQGGKRAAWEYPFAVAGVNITFMIMQMLDLDSSKPSTFVRPVLIQMLAGDEEAFDLLYCVAFMIMDKKWLKKNASYMQFNEILRSTRAQLERELLLDDVLRIENMPSFRLLTQEPHRHQCRDDKCA